MMRGISRRKRVSCPDTTRNPQEPSAVTEAEPSRKRAATSETFRDASEGQLVQDEVPPAYENDLENKDLSEEVQLEEADAENAVESAHATKEGTMSNDMVMVNGRLNKMEEGLGKVLAFLQASSVQVPATHSNFEAQGRQLEKNMESRALLQEGKLSEKLKLDGKLGEVIKDLDVCSEEHILPLVFKCLLKLGQKGWLPSTALIAIATPQRPPVTTKGSKVKCKTDGRLQLQENSLPTVTFEYVGRVVISKLINDLPKEVDRRDVIEEYKHFLSEVSGWKAVDPMTPETKFLFSIYRSAITEFRSRARALFRDSIGASIAPISMGGSEDLQVVLAFPDAAKIDTPGTLDDAMATNFRLNERFVIEVNVKYTVMGRAGSKNERKIQVSLVDLAADCVFWLSGQTHERETSAVLAGIDQFGKKNEKWSLKVLHNFSECLLECLKDYVLPESDECISNARGHAGHLFGVSQEGLKQTQRAAEKLTLLTLREAKKLESLSPFNPEPEHATNSEESGEGSDVDSDEDLIMSD